MGSHKLNIQKYVRHTIKQGESLSKISKNFYGSFDLSGIIAQVNNIKDAARIRVGMELKIPELKDHPFVDQKTTASLGHVTETAVQPEEKTDPLEMYKNLGIEFFENRQFENAVIEFSKVLSSAPSDKESITYIFKAYYQLGSIF